MTLRPMLAATIKEADFPKLRFPLFASPKLDGIRALAHDYLRSRTFKILPNRYIQSWYTRHRCYLEGFDGELIVGNPTGEGVFDRTTSAVRSRAGEPPFIFYVFDHFHDAELPYRIRYYAEALAFNESTLGQDPTFPVRLVPQTALQDIDSLLEYERSCLNLGYEGVMLRHAEAPYKFNRSTFREHYLLKLKRFEDDEAIVIDFIELRTNQNEPETDAFGLTKRSKVSAGLFPADTLGALVCKSKKFTNTFEIGTGFTSAQRQEIWNNRSKYLDKTVKYKFQRIGTMARPRAPVFLGFRAPFDF